MKPLARQVALWPAVLLLPVLMLMPLPAIAQKKQKEEKPEKEKTKQQWPSPHKATLWALIPGAGQVYNKKYWKLPIVYAGFAVTGYFGIANRTEYLKYREAFLCSEKADNNTNFTCDNPLAQKYKTGDLLSITNYYRKNMELSFIIMGGWYILQILDAAVDANLYYWNVDDNLSLQIEPVIQPFNIPNQLPAHNGIRITLKF